MTASTTADVESGIRDCLATIRRYWDGTEDPPKSGGVSSRSLPASTLPGNDTAISLRAEVQLDLALWVHALVQARDDLLGHWEGTGIERSYVLDSSIDCTDVPAMARFLAGEAAWISGWEYGNRMWDDLTTLAREVRNVASPPRRDTMPLGECPECGTVVRAKAHDPGNIRCKGCGTTDTIDGWIIRVVGSEPLVTATQLVPILHKRMGIVATPSTIGTWLNRGVIHSSDTDTRGRALFDRKAVFAALAHREHKQREAASGSEPA